MPNEKLKLKCIQKDFEVKAFMKHCMKFIYVWEFFFENCRTLNKISTSSPLIKFVAPQTITKLIQILPRTNIKQILFQFNFTGPSISFIKLLGEKIFEAFDFLPS